MSSALNLYVALEFLIYARMTSSPKWAWASFATSCTAGDRSAGGVASLPDALPVFQNAPAIVMQTTAIATPIFWHDRLVVFMWCILLKPLLAFMFKIYKHRNSSTVSMRVKSSTDKRSAT
jgi:hypothetical protein